MLHLENLLRAAVLAAALGAAGPASASAATGSIHGTVTAVDGGAAVTQYAVDLYSAGRTKVDTVCTNGTGGYAFAGLATGTYYVSFSGDPAAPCVRTGFAPVWFSGFLAAKNATPVAVTDGVDHPGVDAALQPEATISGTVKAPGGAVGKAGVSVRVIDSDGVEGSRACTAADGTYTVHRLTPVPYVVQFVDDGSCGVAGSSPSRFYRVGTPAGSATAAGASSVSSSYGGDTPGIDLTLSPVEHTLTVTVTGSGTVASADGSIACAPTCAASRPEGSTSTLTATPAAGFAFTGWSGACTGAGACSVTLAGDKSVGAVFTAVPGGGGAGGGGGGGGGGAGGGGGGGGAGTPTTTTPGGTTTTPGGTATTPARPATAPTPPAAAATTPKAKCRVAAPSKIKRGRFSVKLSCDRSAKLVLGGTLKFKTGKRTTTVKLKASTTTARTKTLTIKLPAKAARALKAKRRLSATITLKATTTGGTATVTRTAKRLR